MCAAVSVGDEFEDAAPLAPLRSDGLSSSGSLLSLFDFPSSSQPTAGNAPTAPGKTSRRAPRRPSLSIPAEQSSVFSYSVSGFPRPVSSEKEETFPTVEPEPSATAALARGRLSDLSACRAPLSSLTLPQIVASRVTATKFIEGRQAAHRSCSSHRPAQRGSDWSLSVLPAACRGSASSAGAEPHQPPAGAQQR